jgi:hypothetical protein
MCRTVMRIWQLAHSRLEPTPTSHGVISDALLISGSIMVTPGGADVTLVVAAQRLRLSQLGIALICWHLTMVTGWQRYGVRMRANDPEQELGIVDRFPEAMRPFDPDAYDCAMIWGSAQGFSRANCCSKTLGVVRALH